MTNCSIDIRNSNDVTIAKVIIQIIGYAMITGLMQTFSFLCTLISRFNL